MNLISIENILMRVARPSRYLGNEINSVHKDPDAVRLRMALAFPDAYEIGTSHFGLQILYNILNAETDIAAERVFAPGMDMAAHLKSSGVPLFSLESHTPLSRFDIIGFSLLYELNYTNVLLMLDLAGIPFYAADRDETQPLIIAGGPCTVNPEPMADFFDAMVVGDGEEVILEMARAAIAWKSAGSGNREELLKAWSGIEGVYIPSFFEPVYDDAGRQRLRPRIDGCDRVVRAVAADLDLATFPESPIVPFGNPVHDRIRLEVARGCTRGCRFCQAGMIYRPVRERALRNLTDLAAHSISATGYEELSLLSLSTGDYSCLAPLMRHLIERYAERRLAISIPSFRAGTLRPEMMELIRKIRKTGFTIAPEAGSERLRNVINKNISEEEIVQTVSSAFELGWKLIKLYFMVGLPTETDADLAAIAELAGRLKKIRCAGRPGQITVSAATFIPKAHTPFQWVKQIDLETARNKIETLRRHVRFPGVQFKWQKPETSILEGLFARGDRRLSNLLVTAYKNGCTFDGWTDSFNFAAWTEALNRTGIDPDIYSGRNVEMDAPLPWDHIDTRVTGAFLKDEYARALAAASTPDCRTGECQGCGVCDFKRLEPRIAADDNEIELMYTAPDPAGPGTAERLKLTFSRSGRSRYFGHLEMTNILIRAIGRAGIPVAFSRGFHPKPKIAFDDALPVGTESFCEKIYITLTSPAQVDQVKTALNRQLPAGLEVIDCRIAPPGSAVDRPETVVYIARMEPEGYDPERLKAFQSAESVLFRRRTKKGAEKTMDLKHLVREILLLSPVRLWLRLENGAGAGIRPSLVIREIFAIPEDRILDIRITKLPESAAPDMTWS